MKHRERIKAIIAGEPADRCGFWLGLPVPETWPILCAYFGKETEEEVRLMLGDDFRLLSPTFMGTTYNHPPWTPFPTNMAGGVFHPAAGPLAHVERVEQLDQYDWPDLDYLTFDEALAALDNAGDVYRASGFWTHFYHHLMDMFGMQEYFVKMLTHPDVVHAATDRVCGFYYEANRRFFEAAGDRMDGFMFANDLGTQRDLMVGPKQVAEFILPWYRKFSALAHSYGYQVIYHSCGSIYPVIGELIATGIDCLHPLQARAVNMDAATLAREFGGRVAFMGGIDVQDLMVRGSPDDVRREVRRVSALLGPRYIVSPSHEGVLPDVPPANIAALAQAITEIDW
ncbi:MAG: hypothetical protein GX601_04720 [Anaerolineales bacterium]|nr:hypothetical protein [Anaerolineales bacterium]